MKIEGVDCWISCRFAHWYHYEDRGGWLLNFLPLCTLCGLCHQHHPSHMRSEHEGWLWHSLLVGLIVKFLAAFWSVRVSLGLYGEKLGVVVGVRQKSCCATNAKWVTYCVIDTSASLHVDREREICLYMWEEETAKIDSKDAGRHMMLPAQAIRTPASSAGITVQPPRGGWLSC